MKNLSMKYLNVCFFVLPIAIYAQQPIVQTVKSEIKQVKLFLTSGEIFHEEHIKIQKGRN